MVFVPVYHPCFLPHQLCSFRKRAAALVARLAVGMKNHIMNPCAPPLYQDFPIYTISCSTPTLSSSFLKATVSECSSSSSPETSGAGGKLASRCLVEDAAQPSVGLLVNEVEASAVNKRKDGVRRLPVRDIDVNALLSGRTRAGSSCTPPVGVEWACPYDNAAAATSRLSKSRPLSLRRDDGSYRSGLAFARIEQELGISEPGWMCSLQVIGSPGG